MEAMLASGIDYTIYFYNPNIHPLKEYMLRKEENMRFADKFGIPFIDKDDDYEKRPQRMVRQSQRHGIRTRTRHPLHHVFRHAFRKSRPIRPRKRLPRLHQLAGHFPLEKHGANQRLRPPRRRALRRRRLLGFQLAQRRRQRTHDRNQQNANTSTNKNTAAAPTPCATPTPTANRKAASPSNSAYCITATSPPNTNPRLTDRQPKSLWTNN